MDDSKWNKETFKSPEHDKAQYQPLSSCQLDI